MNPDRDPHEELERLIARVLQDQPLRHAPATLADRVLARIEGRAASRWRQGFAHWPVAARLAFVVASVGFVKAGLLIASWLATPLDSTARAVELPSQVAWIETLLVAIATIARSVPPLWAQAAIAVLAIMYVALFGIGASAYRALRAAH